jgi:hypothetical protein
MVGLRSASLVHCRCACEPVSIHASSIGEDAALEIAVSFASWLFYLAGPSRRTPFGVPHLFSQLEKLTIPSLKRFVRASCGFDGVRLFALIFHARSLAGSLAAAI